jgi:hypothetical protein
VKTLVREVSPILAAEVRQRSAEYLSVPSAFAVLWAETLPEDVLLTSLDLFGLPRERARPMIARFISSGWMTHLEVSPGVYTFTLAGPVRPLIDKILSPELMTDWPGAFDQLIFHFDRSPQPELAEQVRYLGELVGYSRLAPGVFLGFTPMGEVARRVSPALAEGNLIETGTLSVPEDAARRILESVWDFDLLRAMIAERRQKLREADDSALSGRAAVQRLRDLYLDRTLLISGPGRIPESVRPHRLGLWRMAEEYAERLDDLDAITGPVITEAVGACEHADLIVTRSDDSPQTR